MSENPPRPNHDADAPPRKRRSGCVWACIGLVVLLCGGGWLLLFVDVPLRISEETTYITQPLTADGKKVDYFAAIELEYYPENMKTDDNGYRLIVKNLGDLIHYFRWGGGSAEYQAQALEKLGLDPRELRQPPLKFQAPSGFLWDYIAGEEFEAGLIEKLLSEDASQEGPADGAATDAEQYNQDQEDYGDDKTQVELLDVLRDKLYKPWTLDDLPMMLKWLEENGPALDLIGQSVGKPSFRVPMVRGDETEPLVGLMLYDGGRLMRSFARALRARGYYRIATGDIDGAIDDILACKRLGRHVGRGGSMIEGLTGIAIEGMADSIGLAASLAHQPTEAQLQRLLDEWETLPTGADVNESMLWERYCSLGWVQEMAHGDLSLGDLFVDTPGLFDDMPGFLGALACDWNVVAKRLNEHHDNLEKGFETEGLTWNSLKLLHPEYRSRVVGDILGDTLLSPLEAWLGVTRREECHDNLHRITLAMLIHERRHGALPPAFTVDADGAPLHSWRVVLLPYLGQQELYDKIRLDEPWDSPHNRQFHQQAVSFYQCPSAELEPGQTNYSVVVGPDMPFAAGEGKSLADFGPLSEDMILIVERALPVCWMDPTQEVPQAVAEEGINVSRTTPAAPARPNGIASQHPGGADFGRRDGAAVFLSETTEIETFRKLLNGTNDNGDY